MPGCPRPGGSPVGQVDGSVGVPGRNPHVGGNLDVVPAVDVPEGPPADVELEVPVGEVGLDARLAEAGHPEISPSRSSESPLAQGRAGSFFRGGASGAKTKRKSP